MQEQETKRRIMLFSVVMRCCLCLKTCFVNVLFRRIDADGDERAKHNV